MLRAWIEHSRVTRVSEFGNDNRSSLAVAGQLAFSQEAIHKALTAVE